MLLKWVAHIFGKNLFTVEVCWKEKVNDSFQDIRGWVIDILNKILKESITLKDNIGEIFLFSGTKNISLGLGDKV